MVRISNTLFTCSIIICALFLYCNAFSQNSVLINIKNNFDNYRRNTLQEKIFMHTDKNSYLAGEIMWFKLYNVDAAFHKPLDLSKVAYIELLDANNKSVLRAKIALKQGSGNGSLFIPFAVNSGNYKLRAYTNWMKNFDVNYFFEKNISIINTQKAYETDSLKPLQYNVEFFPEGGNLVDNIQSKVAFKVSDQYGKSTGYNGVVINENNDTILKFQPLKFGMGNFIFTPSVNHTYKAIIQTPNGNTITKKLPEVYKEGYVLSVINNGSDAITVNVKTNIVQPQETYLFVHARETICTAERLLIQNGNASFTINKNKLGDGISHITLFNNAQQPVCERLYFKCPSKILALRVSADEKEYGTREKINLAITSTSENKKDVAANLSVAVYRFDSLQTTDGDNINSYLWLSSDLNGKIESPAYYFSSAVTQEEIDNLMLTQGWRRFKWEDISQNKTPVFKFAPEYNGHIITGKIIDTRTNTPAKNITAYLSVPGLRTQFANYLSNDSGEVKFELKDFYNSTEIIAQTKQPDSFYRVDITDPFSENHTADLLLPYTLPQYPNTLKAENLSVQIQNVYAGNKVNQFMIPSFDTTAFYYSPDERYYLDDYTRFTTMEEVLREYITTIDVRKKEKSFHLAAANENTRRLFDQEPLVLLDGVPVFDIDKFMNFDPLKIKKLEVVTRRYFLGGSFFEGIANWTTYNGDLANFELDPHATIIDYEALQLKREFYSPVYETEEQRSSHFPDFRNVLFWSPNITTIQGKQQLSFYSSDLPGKYIIVLQGLTNDGKSGYSVTTFDVRK